MTTTVEIHLDGAWWAAGELRTVGPDRAQFSYLPQYVFGDAPQPVALGLPVSLQPPDEFVEDELGMRPNTQVPAFVYDLVPQGRGRRYLVDLLNLTDSDALVMPLVMAGAFNPIGRLRLSSAVDFYQAQAAKETQRGEFEGLQLDDILKRTDEFLDHISLHSMLATGTTGVQGVAPKFLLTTNREGRWYADLALPDEDANEHWLLKLPRGRSDEDRAVLRNEAFYLRLAAMAGIRTHAEPMLKGEMLFVRRFDRAVVNGRVTRLGQESIASVIGQRGFGVAQSQQALLAGIRAVATDPLQETIEFIKRDVLNMAMRNTDNHARNTAMQTDIEGTVRLTPLFDFAPMFMDPEVVPRSCHWKDPSGNRLLTWPHIIASLDIPEQERETVATALHDFAETVGRLPQLAKEAGVEAVVLEQCRQAIDAQANDLVSLQGRSNPVPAAAPPAPARKRMRP